MIETPGLYVFFDLRIPGIGLHFGKPIFELTSLGRRELFNLGLNLNH